MFYHQTESYAEVSCDSHVAWHSKIYPEKSIFQDLLPHYSKAII